MILKRGLQIRHNKEKRRKELSMRMSGNADIVALNSQLEELQKQFAKNSKDIDSELTAKIAKMR